MVFMDGRLDHAASLPGQKEKQDGREALKGRNNPDLAKVIDEHDVAIHIADE